MKKLIIALLLSLAVCALCAVPAAAGAESASVQGTAAGKAVEYSADGIYIPILRTEEGQAYIAEVFDAADTEYASPLTVENNIKFYPDKLGEYNIRYLLNDSGVESYVYDSLTVQDTSMPTFTLTVQAEYRAGDTVLLIPAVEDNTAEWAQVSYQMIRDGRVCTDEIVSGRFVAEKAGSYKVMVTVTDAGGNAARETYSFTVTGGTAPGGTNTGLIIGLGVGGAVIVLAAASAVFIILKKRGERAKKGGSDESDR